MNYVSRFIFLLPIFVFVGCATHPRKATTMVNESAHHLKYLFSHGQPVWDQCHLDKEPILFVSHKDNQVSLFRNSQLSKLNPTLWLPKIPTNPIEFLAAEIDGQKYLILFVDKFTEEESSLKMTTMVLHEGFHSFCQQSWDRQFQGQSRGNIYPIQTVPRYYRWEMYDSLLSYLEKGRKLKDLRHFSYWYQKWQKNFPEEAKNYTDRVEGSAEFYTTLMVARLKSHLQKKTVSPLEVLLDRPSLSQVFDLSYESYVLGSLAGLILDHKNVKNWQKSVAKGSSPLQILSQQQKPLRKNVNNVKQTELLKISVEKMQAIDSDGKLDRVISGLASQKMVRVSIPLKILKPRGFAASAMYQSFFDFPGVKNVQLTKLKSDLPLIGPGFQYTIPNSAIWIMAEKSPCDPSSSALLLFDPDQVVMTKKELTLKDKVQTKFHGESKLVNTISWFCVKD